MFFINENFTEASAATLLRKIAGSAGARRQTPPSVRVSSMLFKRSAEIVPDDVVHHV
jgi:hypothetical protein